MSLLKTNEIQNYNGSSLTLTASTVSTSAQLNTGGNISVTGSLNVSDDSTTRTNLGLGTIATQDSDSITVTGGTATLGALTVSGSDSGDLVRITQTGSGNALVVEDETNPDSTPFVVNTDGRVLVGTSSEVPTFGLNGGFQIFGDNASKGSLSLRRGSNDAQGVFVTIVKSRSSTDGTSGVCLNGDEIGRIIFQAADGNDLASSACEIAAIVDGSCGTDDTPGKLVFKTTADGASATTERMSINSSGAVSIVGSLSKGSGSFKIDHPMPEKTDTHHLVHSFVEAPQADLIYRGKVDLVDGSATVNIDTAAGMTEGTFVALNRDLQCFTSNESGWTNVRGSVSGNILTIEAEDNNSSDTISWLVIGERQDQHMYDTEWTDENGKVIVEPLKEIEALETT